MGFPIPKLPVPTRDPAPSSERLSLEEDPILLYSESAATFFFASLNPNARKIHGVATQRVGGKLVYVIPRFYPANLFALKDFKALFPKAKASPQAVQALAILKGVPDQIRDLHYLEQITSPFWKTFPPKTHQLRAIEAMLHMPYLAILADPGLGKTYIALNFLEAYERVFGKRLKMLVLAPKIALRNWEAETLLHTKQVPLRYEGSPDKRKALREDILGKHPWDVLITNYEAVTPVESRARQFQVLRKSEIQKDDQVQLEKEGEWYFVQGVEGARTRRIFTVRGMDSTEYRIPSPKILKARRYLANDLSYLEDYDFFTNQLEYDVLIMDEGHRVKGHDSKRSTAVNNIGQRAAHRYILSGTITLGSPLDLYMPFTVLHPTILNTNFWRFKSRYCVTSEYNKHAVVGFKNLDDLKRHIDPYIAVFKRDDCLDLPDRTFIRRYYWPSCEQTRIYNNIVEEGVVELQGRSIPLEMSVLRINKLLQVMSGFFIFPIQRDDTACNDCEFLEKCLDEDIYPWQKKCAWFGTDQVKGIQKPKREYYTFSSNPKLEALEEILEEIGTEKVIIWAYYQKELEDIQALLLKRGMGYVLAGTPDCDLVFNTDPSKQVFLGQSSQGIAITLNAAKYMVYYSRSLKLEDRLQSLDRNYRIGQEEKVVVYDLVCPVSLEFTVLKMLDEKKDIKEFFHELLVCGDCEKQAYCQERAIRIYSEKCVWHARREEAEKRSIIRLRKMPLHEGGWVGVPT
ncbi:MAG: DEAD/DEAH box helicase [Candidatus Cloacimonetes bacterium]|nr:DEAD/DEAH box helicase [Candidatus Cloacimonadota bacterium]MDY0171624.1 DEAD/DEAH box helicase [Candidatus Cloacimonadaceae bacterium]